MTIKWVEIPTAGKVRMLIDMLDGYPTEIMEGGYFTFDPAQIQPVIDAEAKYKIIPHGFDAREMLF